MGNFLNQNHSDLSQEELPQREERQRKIFFVFLRTDPSPRVDYTGRKSLREKRKMSHIKISLGSAQKESFHREKKDEEKSFLFLC